MGFKWGQKEEWDTVFAYLKAYKEEHGHCLVPARFKTTDGYALGTWVSNQRTTKEVLDPERIQLLDGLGFFWDSNRLAAELRDLVHELSNDTALLNYDAIQVVGDFLNRHINSTLVVENSSDKRKSSHMPTIPTLEPKGKLINRYEPDTGKLFITAKHFKNDCVELQLNYQDILSKLKHQGIFLGTEAKRMSKGMKIVSSGVHALVFDCSHPDFTVDLQNLYTTGEE